MNQKLKTHVKCCQRDNTLRLFNIPRVHYKALTAALSFSPPPSLSLSRKQLRWNYRKSEKSLASTPHLKTIPRQKRARGRWVSNFSHWPRALSTSNNAPRPAGNTCAGTRRCVSSRPRGIARQIWPASCGLVFISWHPPFSFPPLFRPRIGFQTGFTHRHA